MRHQAEITEGYDRVAAQYDHLHGRRKYQARAERMEAPLRGMSGRVLEIGCGTGRLLSRVSGDRYGVDVSREMLRLARARSLAVAVGDAHALPFDSGSFDAIIAGKGVFRYLETEAALAACARVLRPGGLLGVHQYAARTWSLRGRRSKPVPGHLETAGALAVPAARAGFRLEHAQPWRSIAMAPYIVPIRARLPGRWWSQIVLIFRLCKGD